MAIRFMRGHAQNVGAILDGQPLLIREDGKSYYHLHAGIGSNNYAPCAADPNIYQDTSINWAVPNTTANYRIWGTSTGMTIRAVADPSATSTPGIALSTNSSDKNSDEAINWYFTGADFRPGATGQTMGEVRPFDSGRMTTLKTDNITTSSYATVHIHKTLVPEEISSGITLGTGSAPFYSINTQRIFVHNDDTDDSTACSVWMYAPTASNNAVLTYSPQNGDADQFMLGINYTKGTGYNGTIQLGNFAARTTICGTNLMRFSLRDQVGGSGGGAIAFNGTSMYPTLEGNEIMLLNKLGTIDRFDIVVLKLDGENNNLIKRIIGLPGEKVEIKDNEIYINDELLEDDYGYGVTYNIDAVTLADDEYFILGDNRIVSLDSRVFGKINRSEIKGTTNFIMYPFSKIGKVE